jgi:signal recognition particle subunit SEC65
VPDIPNTRREGDVLIIQLPQRGRQAAKIPDELIDTLLKALQDMTLDTREGIVVPEQDNPKEPRLFEKQHQATNYGRRLKDELAVRDPKIVEQVQISTPPVEYDQDGKPRGPFILALAKK